MKNFISNNLITIVIVLFVLAGVYQMRNKFDLTAIDKKQTSADGYKLYNHSAIHTISYSGDITESKLSSIGQFLEDVTVFKTNKSNRIRIKSESGKYAFFLRATDKFIANPPDDQIYFQANWLLGLKDRLLNNTNISLILTDNNWIEKKSFTESQLKEIQSKFYTQYGNTQQTSAPINENVQNILNRWSTGASNLSNAINFFEVKDNSRWRIYYSPSVSNYVQELGNQLHDGKLFLDDRHTYLAFYKEVDTLLFKNQEAYFIACPFSEDQLNNGQAEKSIELINDYIKPKYFSETRLVVVATDYDFKPAYVKGTY